MSKDKPEVIIFPKDSENCVPSFCILVLKKHQEVFFSGKLKITILFGSCSILGYKICNNKSQFAYSPRGQPALSIKWSKNANKTSLEQLRQFLINELNVTTIFYDTLNKYFDASCDTVLKLDTFDNKLLQFLKNNAECNLFSDINCSLSSTIGNTKLDETQVRLKLSEAILQCKLSFQDEAELKFKMPLYQKINGIGEVAMNYGDRVLICGGKGLGKSTLFRYLINKNISAGRTVVAVDFDIGQSEFMVPGCIGAVRVQAPLLGPNFTHLQNEMDKLIFIGDLNVTRKVNVYMNAIVEMANFCNYNFDRTSTVLVINTMGFNRSVGIDINYMIIEQMQPTAVIQLKCKNEEANYPDDFTHENVTAFESDLSWYRKADEQLQPFRYFSLLQSFNHSKWSMESKMCREIVILAYCSKILEGDCKYLTEVQPFRVNLNDIHHIFVLDFKLDEINLLRTINGTLVALCKRNRYKTLGFGIIRDIDFVNRNLYLLTSVDPEILEEVDCIIKGHINLPDVLYINVGPHVTGSVPFVTRKLPEITNRKPKRTYRSYQNQ